MSFRSQSAFRVSHRRSTAPRYELPDQAPSAKLRLYAALAAGAVIGFSLGLCYFGLELLRWAGVVKP